MNPYASSSNNSNAGNIANQESVYTQSHGSLTQTTASNPKNISSMVPNLTSRVVFNGAVNTVSSNRQVSFESFVRLNICLIFDFNT